MSTRGIQDPRSAQQDDETLYEDMSGAQSLFYEEVNERIQKGPPPLPPRAPSMIISDNPSYTGKVNTKEDRYSLPSAPPPYEGLKIENDRLELNDTKSPPHSKVPLGHEKSLSVDSAPKDQGSTPEEKKLIIAAPTGYSVMRYLARGNVIYLIPKEAGDGCPLTISGGTIRGGGSFNDESKLEVFVPHEHPTECVVALRNLKHKDRFLCIDSKGKIKARNGYKDSCDFFVTVVGDASSPVVCFESARTGGYFLGLSDNAVIHAATITADSGQAHFLIRADDCAHSGVQPKLRVFGKDSIMNQVHDKSVIRLFSHRRYLAIDKKGNVIQTHNSQNEDSWFVLFDRGMGIVSLRSYKYRGFWLKLKEGKLITKGMLDSDSFFTVKESENHLVCFESVGRPGLFVAPPLRNQGAVALPEFALEIVLLPDLGMSL